MSSPSPQDSQEGKSQTRRGSGHPTLSVVSLLLSQKVRRSSVTFLWKEVIFRAKYKYSSPTCNSSSLPQQQTLCGLQSPGLSVPEMAVILEQRVMVEATSLPSPQPPLFTMDTNGNPDQFRKKGSSRLILLQPVVVLADSQTHQATRQLYVGLYVGSHLDTSAMCIWRNCTQRSSSSSKSTTFSLESLMPVDSYLKEGNRVIFC